MPTTPVVGIDGYPGGWVAARLHQDTVTWATAGVDGVSDLISQDAITAIDMPIGILDSGERECDLLARRALSGAASRVFITPPRRVLEIGLAAPNHAAQEAARQLMGKGVSRQALGLATRILALDAALNQIEGVVLEVHPEISFAELAGHVLDSKKRARGIGQRMAALETWLPNAADIVADTPADVPIDDSLDALAALWSAARWRDGNARTLPVGTRVRPFIAI
jgi:predicted RNase H-like nuclease